MRYLLTIGCVLMLAFTAEAQYPTQPNYGVPSIYGPAFNPSNFMPNIFNPSTQPLSPYLNLMRGGDPGVNYYYGVKPGTLGMGGGMSGRVPFMAPGGNRMLYFPQLASAPDPTSVDPIGTGQPGTGDVLPPAGHPVTFGNTMGFFPSPFGQAGGARAGLSGLGARRR